MSDQGDNGGSNPDWGMTQPPQYAQPMAPPQQPYGGQPAYGAPPRGFYPPPKSNKGLIITLISVIGVLVLAGIVLLIIWLSGGFSGSSRSSNSSWPTTTNATTSNSTTTATVSSGADAAVTDEWLKEGYWKEACSSNNSVYFGGGQTALLSLYDNGRNTMGSYSLSGNVVTMNLSGQSLLMTVERLGQNRMRATLNGRTEVLTRCTGSGTSAYPVN